MSGGHFDYQQYRIGDIAEKLRIEIARCRTKQEYATYSNEFLVEMISAYHAAKELEIIVHRIDWVISADDSEETYFERIKEDMAEIERDDPSRDGYWLTIHDDDD